MNAAAGERSAVVKERAMPDDKVRRFVVNRTAVRRLVALENEVRQYGKGIFVVDRTAGGNGAVSNKPAGSDRRAGAQLILNRTAPGRGMVVEENAAGNRRAARTLIENRTVALVAFEDAILNLWR